MANDFNFGYCRILTPIANAVFEFEWILMLFKKYRARKKKLI